MEGGHKNLSLGFDAKRALYNYSGLGNYSRNLLAALLKYYPENTYALFTPSLKNRITLPDEEKYSIISPGGRFLSAASPLWRSGFIVKDIKRKGIDIFHGLSQELPYGIEKSGVTSVVTVHDLIFLRFPDYYKWFDTRIYTSKVKHACHVASHVVAISRQTRSDLIEFLNVPEEKISVIYQGCNPWFRDFKNVVPGRDIKTKYGLPDRYLLYVSTIEERKNLIGILKAMVLCRIDMPLVVIGRKSEPYFSHILSFIKENNLKNIIFPGGIANTELPGIYKGAECLVYPSFFEGFGIPILEAMVSGTPVITSSGGCFAEAGGPGSIYVDPVSPEEIGKAITAVLNDPGLRNKMISSGAEYAENFREDIIARNYMDLYTSLGNQS